MTFAIQHESAVGIHVQVHLEPLPPPSLPHPSRFSQRTHCNSYPCSSVYNPLQHLASTLDFTLFLCLWFPATLMQYTLVYGGMAVFLLLSAFWASWSMAVWCLFYILKSSWSRDHPSGTRHSLTSSPFGTAPCLTSTCTSKFYSIPRWPNNIVGTSAKFLRPKSQAVISYHWSFLMVGREAFDVNIY